MVCVELCCGGDGVRGWVLMVCVGQFLFFRFLTFGPLPHPSSQVKEVCVCVGV